MSTTARDITRRIQLWLAKTARGDLHDSAQPPDPLFFPSPLELVLPATALADAKEPVELAGFLRADNERLIVSRVMQPSDNVPTFTVLAFKGQPQAMSRLRYAPRSLAALAAELEKSGVDLFSELKARLKKWAGLAQTDVRRLSTRLAIVVAFPVTEGERQTANDIRGFLTLDSAGDIGVALGVLHATTARSATGAPI